MATLDVRRLYSDGSILFGSDLDAIIDDIESLINVIKLNDDNLQNEGITGSTKLINSSVTGGKLASNSVTTAKITDLNVTTAKLADTAVTTAKITDLNVTTAKIADLAVTNAKIADATITASKLAFIPAWVVDSYIHSTTWVVPAGVVECIVTAVGGGGSGGSGDVQFGRPGGGGAGSIPQTGRIGLVAGETVTIVVGLGGAAPPPLVIGNPGGNSSVSAISGSLTFFGGAGGFNGFLGGTARDATRHNTFSTAGGTTGVGEFTNYAVGGTGAGPSGGGGGGAGIGPGGNGGGINSPGSVGSFGGGGGGGGGGVAGTGGTGGGGLVYISYVRTT